MLLYAALHKMTAAVLLRDLGYDKRASTHSQILLTSVPLILTCFRNTTGNGTAVVILFAEEGKTVWLSLFPSSDLHKHLNRTPRNVVYSCAAHWAENGKALILIYIGD